MKKNTVKYEKLIIIMKSRKLIKVKSRTIIFTYKIFISVLVSKERVCGISGMSFVQVLVNNLGFGFQNCILTK